MRLIIHDLGEAYNEKIRECFNKDGKEIQIIAENGKIHHCIGCFGCWIKTPGQCVLKDDYNQMGALSARTEEMIIISECLYGTYSPFVRNILDRCLSYVHCDFTKRNGEIHHKLRYDNQMHTTVYFYGAVNNEEKETARKIVKANCVNFGGVVENVYFTENKEEILDESCTC